MSTPQKESCFVIEYQIYELCTKPIPSTEPIASAESTPSAVPISCVEPVPPTGVYLAHVRPPNKSTGPNRFFEYNHTGPEAEDKAVLIGKNYRMNLHSEQPFPWPEELTFQVKLLSWIPKLKPCYWLDFGPHKAGWLDELLNDCVAVSKKESWEKAVVIYKVKGNPRIMVAVVERNELERAAEEQKKAY